jgi:hypothetical protein
MIMALWTEGINEASHFSAPLSWLGKTPFRDLVAEPCLAELSFLCNFLDQSHDSIVTADGVNIGLEIHLGPKIATDISIFGDQGLPSVPGINYPTFAAIWLDFIGETGLQNSFSQHLAVEFDYQDSGYCLRSPWKTQAIRAKIIP